MSHQDAVFNRKLINLDNLTTVQNFDARLDIAQKNRQDTPKGY